MKFVLEVGPFWIYLMDEKVDSTALEFSPFWRSALLHDFYLNICQNMTCKCRRGFTHVYVINFWFYFLFSKTVKYIIILLFFSQNSTLTGLLWYFLPSDILPNSRIWITVKCHQVCTVLCDLNSFRLFVLIMMSLFIQYTCITKYRVQ